MMRAGKAHCGLLVAIIFWAALTFGQLARSRADKTAHRLAEYLMSQPGIVDEARKLRGHCDDAESSAVTTACWKLEFDDANEHMNTLYKTLLGKLDTRQSTNLHKIQRAWERYRDLHCNGTAAQYEGGSLQPAVFYSCEATVTKARIQDIESSYTLELEPSESGLK
jgi:uncharacterized protein YecT (DUF1311 family)